MVNTCSLKPLKTVLKVQNDGARVMFWGSMTYYSYGPITHLQGSQNQYTYKGLLQDLVLPEFRASSHDLVFQQDNAPCHTAHSIRDFFEENDMEIIDWPPQSPDLSPIEVLWNVLKMKLKALQPRPRTKDSIIRQKLYLGFRKRLEECILS